MKNAMNFVRKEVFIIILITNCNLSFIVVIYRMHTSDVVTQLLCVSNLYSWEC